MSQLGLLGGETPLDQVPSTRSRPLGAHQKEILRYARQHDGIRPVEAGRILHAERPGHHVTHSAAAGRWKGTERAIGCCPWASSDGYEALKRLRDRGYIAKGEDGRWRATQR